MSPADGEVRDERFVAVVGATSACETLADGFLFLEGPLWSARARCLYFTDIPGNAILRWTGDAGVTVFRKPSHMANGTALDREGRLLCCEHATSRVTRTGHDGSVRVLADRFEDKQLNSPNDIVVGRDGSIYFTDPTYGRMEYYGVPRPPEQAVRGVYRIDSVDGRLTRLADDFAQPNGLCLSADERVLFVNDTERMHIRAFDLREDGTLGNGRVWAEVAGSGDGAPDGMKLDRDGNLYCTGPGGIHVFDRDACCLGVIALPCAAANFTWGDDDLQSLFIAATDRLLRMRVRVPGPAA